MGARPWRKACRAQDRAPCLAVALCGRSFLVGKEDLLGAPARVKLEVGEVRFLGGVEGEGGEEVGLQGREEDDFGGARRGRGGREEGREGLESVEEDFEDEGNGLFLFLLLLLLLLLSLLFVGW